MLWYHMVWKLHQELGYMHKPDLVLVLNRSKHYKLNFTGVGLLKLTHKGTRIMIDTINDKGVKEDGKVTHG